MSKPMKTPAVLPICPNAQLGETAEDCPWAAIARAIGAEPLASVNDDLAQLAPGIWNSLKKDSHRDEMKSLWGRSINYDELAKGQIVAPAILDAMAERLGAPARQDILVHAGMEHTYGYLFSVLKTPFGYKRARWVRDDIEAGFALPRGTLGPSPKEGTLFSNVTYFAGTIGLRDQESALMKIKKDGDSVASAIRDYDYVSLQVGRLEESVIVPMKDRSERVITLRTDIVPFPRARASGNTMLLVYSYTDSAAGDSSAKLITAFPVGKNFADQVFNPANLGSGKTVITRYNGYIEGVTGANPPLTGTRRVVSRFE